jgi:hypothetical protein
MNLLGSPVPKDTAERRNPKYVLESIVNAGAGVSPSIYNEDESVRKALEGLVEVTDNYNLLKFQKLVDAISVSSVRKAVGTRLDKASMTFATESYKFFEGKKAEGKMTEEQMKQLLYRNSVSQYKPFLTIPSKDNLRRKSVGRPMVIDIPSEAAVPIHVPGSPAKHIGYMVPVDADGNFITLGSVFDNATGMAGMMSSDKSNSSLGSLLTEKARKNLATQNDQPTIENATEIYADIIEKDFLQRLARFFRAFSVKRLPRELLLLSEDIIPAIPVALSNALPRVMKFPSASTGTMYPMCFAGEPGTWIGTAASLGMSITIGRPTLFRRRLSLDGMVRKGLY